MLQSLFGMSYLSLIQNDTFHFANSFVLEKHVKDARKPKNKPENLNSSLISKLLSVHQNPYFVYLQNPQMV